MLKFNENNIADIKAYHDSLFYASVTNTEKMALTSAIAILVSSNYKNFETEYDKLLFPNDNDVYQSREEAFLKFNKYVEMLDASNLVSDFYVDEEEEDGEDQIKTMYGHVVYTDPDTSESVHSFRFYENGYQKDCRKPTEILVDLAEDYVRSLGLSESILTKITSVWNNIRKIEQLNIYNPNGLVQNYNILNVINSFITKCYIHMKNTGTDEDRKTVTDFIGRIFAVINGSGVKGKTGIVLTPGFVSDLMTDLLELDYKNDVLLDGACGTGSFLVTACIKMLSDIDKDFEEGKISAEEKLLYTDRVLNQAIYGNDIDGQMILLALTNFSLLKIKVQNLSNDNFFDLDEGYFTDREINKGILNPPFEIEPGHFILHMIDKLQLSNNNKSKQFVCICPVQDVSKYADKYLVNILNKVRIKAIIKVQDDAFIESKVTQGTSIFIFDLTKPHSGTDKILYYDFSNSGYSYFKDSGLIDKEGLFDSLKVKCINSLKDENNFIRKKRTINEFYEIPDLSNFEDSLDLGKIAKYDNEEIDLSSDNREMKIILAEKEELISECNEYEGIDDYIIHTLSNLEV